MSIKEKIKKCNKATLNGVAELGNTCIDAGGAFLGVFISKGKDIALRIRKNISKGKGEQNEASSN